MIAANRAAIVGIGESAIGKVEDRSALQLHSDAVHAALADAGLSKIDVKRELMRLATRPVRYLQHRRSMPASHPWHWSRLVDAHDEEARVPYIRSVENLIILVAGGWGSKGGITSICPGWGMHGGLTVSKRVIFPSG